MSNMKKFCTIKFPSGHVYEFPLAVVVEDRAKMRATLDVTRTIDQHRVTVTEELGDDFVLVDYIKNNMAWADIERNARLVAYTPPSFAGLAWDDAELATAETPTPAADIGAMGQASVLAPIELAVGQALASDGGAVVLAFAQPGDQKVTSAVIAVAGPQESVQGYIAVVQQFHEFMANGGAAPAAH